MKLGVQFGRSYTTAMGHVRGTWRHIYIYIYVYIYTYIYMYIHFWHIFMQKHFTGFRLQGLIDTYGFGLKAVSKVPVCRVPISSAKL